MNVRLMNPQPDALTGEYVVVVIGRGIASHGDSRREALTIYFYHTLLDQPAELKTRTDATQAEEKTA